MRLLDSGHLAMLDFLNRHIGRAALA